MKSALIPGNQSFYEKLHLFDIGHYQTLVILFFTSVMMLIKDESHAVSLV